MSTPAQLGDILRQLRLDRDLTQEGLAERAKVHRNYISDLERGRRNPSIATLERILKVLNVTWVQLGEALDSPAAPRRSPDR